MGWEDTEITPSGVSNLSMSCVQGKGFVPLCTSIVYTLWNTGYLCAVTHHHHYHFLQITVSLIRFPDCPLGLHQD